MPRKRARVKKVLRKKPKKTFKKRAVKASKKPAKGPQIQILKARPSPAGVVHANGVLPTAYGENQAVFLVRDPWWLYAYWEVTPELEAQVRSRMRAQGLHPEKTVLRVYDVTGTSAERPRSFFDIELNFFADNWYVEVGVPGRQWCFEVGLRTRDGRFFKLVRSNVTGTPPYGISEVLDEEWMLPDELCRRLFGLSGGFGFGSSSLEAYKVSR